MPIKLLMTGCQADIVDGPAPGGKTIMLSDPASGIDVIFSMDPSLTDILRTKMVAASQAETAALLGPDGRGLQTAPASSPAGPSRNGGARPVQRRKGR